MRLRRLADFANIQRPTYALTLATAAVLLTAAPGVAQEPLPERGWQAAPWVKAGYQYPSGQFARNTATDVASGLLETVAELGPSLVAAAGFDVRFPAQGLSVEVGWETTVGAQASGQIAVCALVAGILCETREVATTVQGFYSHLRVLRGQPGGRIRPVIIGGIGVRRYSFAEATCPGGLDDVAVVCRAVTEIYRDPGLHAVIRGGLGGELRSGRFVSTLQATAGVARYSGGTERIGGRWYVDLRTELSAGLVVF